MQTQRFTEFVSLVGRRYFLAQAVFAVPLAALEISGLALIRAFLLLVYLVASGGSIERYLPVLGGMEPITAFFWTVAAIVVFLVLRVIVLVRIDQASHALAMREKVRLAGALFTIYLGQPYHLQVTADRSRQSMTVLNSSTDVMHQLLIPATQLFIDCLVMLAILLVLGWMEPLATLAVSVWLTLLFGIQAKVGSRRSQDSGVVRFGALHRMRNIVDSALGDVRALKLGAHEPAFLRLFHDQSEEHGRAVQQELSLDRWPIYIREFAVVSVITVLVGTLLFEGVRGPDLIASLSVFGAASIWLLPSLQRTVNLWQRLYARAPDVSQILADLKLPVEKLAGRQENPKALFHEAMILDRISLTFPSTGKRVLENISLRIEPADRIEICGPSGVGKSTLVQVICGLLRPDRGTITLDGQTEDLLDRMRSARVALIAQDPFILSGSLRENLAFPGRTDSLDDVAAEAIIRDFGLKLSLDADATAVARMSGGERQRVAIARAVLSQPELLILDEATSQLDPATEMQVCSIIAERCASATLLMIAHRPLPDVLRSRRFRLADGRLIHEPVATA